MNKVLIIVPCYNEEKNISGVISELQRDMPQADVLIVNDCSTDGTLDILKSVSGIFYLSLPFNLGYSGAIQTGFKYAMKYDYEYVIQFDGDGQHIASEAARMLDVAKDTGSDIVIGSRFKIENGYKHGFFRRLGTNLYRGIIRLVCNVNITDPTSGLQVLSRDVFSRYARMYCYPEYPDANLIIEMLLRGYRIEEISVRMRRREFGVSMHSGAINAVKYMIKMMYSILLLILQKRELSNKNTRRGVNL